MWSNEPRTMRLVIHADDCGYTPEYDRGILEAACAGAIDGASAMVLRDPDPAPLLESGVAAGLHLEGDDLEGQIARFEGLFGRGPDYVDGHKHCHARGRIAVEVADYARQAG